MRTEESSAFLGSGKENIATARNVTELSKGCENTLRISQSQCLLMLYALYLAQGLEHIKYVWTDLKVNV